jgi:hypothetical protein
MGNLSIAVYGFLLFDTHWNEVGFGTAPFSDPDAELSKKVTASTRYDFPIFANGMPGGFLMSIRQSRLGARLELPTPDIGTTLRGRLEFDLLGGFLSSNNAISWFTPLPRLRLAFLSAAWKLGDRASIGFVAGQDTGLYAPVSAVSAALNGGPVFGAAGNTGGVRSPQFRLEGQVGSDVAMTWGVGVLSPADNFSNDASIQAVTADFGPGNASGRPNFEARLGLLYKRENLSVVELAISAHRGWERYVVQGGHAMVPGGAIATDLQGNFGVVGVRGEAFIGKNMDSVIGNFFTDGVTLVGASSTSTPPTSVVPIRTRGGWGQLVLQPLRVLQVFGGVGVEDPNDQDLGVSPTSNPNTKTFNRQFHAGTIVIPAKAWTLGAEWMKTTTHYAGVLPRSGKSVLSGNHIALSTTFTF